MATYSRTTTTVQSSQAQPTVASKDLGNFVVKSLENLMNENQGEDDYQKNDDYLKDIQDTITKGIDESKLVKDDKSQPGKKSPLSGSGNLAALLVNKNNTTTDNSKNSPLLGLLQKQNTETKRESAKGDRKHGDMMKSFGTLAKHMNPANIGKVLIGTFSVAGITGMAKKFGTIALGLVVGLATLSQLAVLVKAAIYGIKANWPSEKIKIGAKIHGWIAALPGEILLGLKQLAANHLLPWLETLPERISNMFAKLFDKFKIGEHGLSKDEQKEYDKLIDDMNAMRAKADKKFDAKMLQVQTQGYAIATEADKYGLNSTDFNFDYVNATDEEYKAYKDKLLAEAKARDAQDGGFFDVEGGLTSMFKSLEKDRNKAKEAMAKLDTGKYKEMEARLFELQEKSKNTYDEEARNKELAEHEAESQRKWQQKLGVDAQGVANEKQRLAQLQKQAEEDYVEKAVYDASAKGEGLSEYTTDRLRSAGYGAQIQSANAKLKEDNIDIKTKAESKEEHWLKNEFEDWKNAWKQFGSDFAKDIGIRIQQAPAPVRNPSTATSSNR